METDWSALLKAVFGSAYLTSDPLNYPDAASISGRRQQSDSHFPDRFSPTVHCARAVVSPCDATVTSFPVAPAQSFTRVTRWNVVPSGCCSETSTDSFESVDNEGYLPV